MKLWRRETANFIVGAVIVLLLAVVGYFVWQNFPQTTLVRIESAAYQLKVANEKTTRDTGLQGVEALDTNGGLLLAYPTSDRWEISMAHLLVDIDIIWLDDAKTVVQIVRDAKASEDTVKTFTPLKKAQYILELPAGSAKKSGIKVGSTAIFTIDEAKD